MLPLKNDIKLQRLPIVTTLVGVICCLVFVLPGARLSAAGLVPLNFVHTVLHPDNRLFTSAMLLFTSFFFHGGILHLLGNMWYLWLFGSTLEAIIGPRRFLLLYIASGSIAMIAQVAYDPLSTIPIIGASGAIAGIMGMYLIVLPFSKISIGIPPLFSFSVFAGLFLLLWFWLQWNSVTSSKASTSTVAWWAHIGGFCFGILAGWSYRLFPPASPKKRRK